MIDKSKLQPSFGSDSQSFKKLLSEFEKRPEFEMDKNQEPAEGKRQSNLNDGVI